MIELAVIKTSENPSVFTLSPSAIEIGGKDSSLIDKLHVSVPDEWKDKKVRITFNQSTLYGGNQIPKFLDENGTVELKSDVTLCSGDLVIDAVGVDGSVSPSTGCHYTVYSHPKFGGTEQVVTPSEYQQFVAETKGYSDSAQANATAANASKEAAALSEQNAKNSETAALAAQQAAEVAKSAAENSANLADASKTDTISLLSDITSKNNNSIAWIGDSLTAMQSALPDESNEWVFYSGFLFTANIRLKQRLNILGTMATSGYTTIQILSSDYVNRAITLNPSYCGVLLGTNDIANNWLADDIYSRLITIYNMLRARNIKVIVTTIPPNNNSNTSQKQQRAKLNALIKKYAYTTQNVFLFDLADAISAEDGDTYATGCNTLEGIHMSNKGGHIAGKYLADILDRIIFPYNKFICSNNDPTNLLSNALFTDGTTLPIGWTCMPQSCSIVQRSDNKSGKWAEITAVDSEEVFFYQSITSGYSVGDTICGTIEFELDGLFPGISDITLRLSCSGSGRKGFVLYQGLSDAVENDNSGVLKTPNIVIPDGTTSISFTVITFGTVGSKVKYARPKLEVQNDTTGI